MNISFLVNGLGYGGAEKMIVCIANSLSEQGYTVNIFNLQNHKDKTQSACEKILIFNFESRHHNIIIKYFSWIKFICQNIRKTKTDVLISFLGIPNFLCSLSGIITNTKTIISERGDPWRSYDNSLTSKIFLFFINQSSGAVFQTVEAGKFYSKKLQKRACVIHNPIFVESSIPIVNYDNISKCFISLGRIDNHQKRLDILVDSFAIVIKKYPSYRLLIYGGGPDYQWLKDYVFKKGLMSYVLFMGVSKNSFHDLSKGGIFVLTSDYEGISNSLLEAMACGLPVISTDHTPGGGRLLIKNYYNGLLVPTNNADALSKAMMEYIERPDLLKICGNNAKNVLNDYSLEKIIKEWIAYIEEIYKK